MKISLLTLLLFLSYTIYSQDYQLIPDSCTYCAHKTSTGGNSWYNTYYKLDPTTSIQYNGNQYIQFELGPYAGAWGYPLGVRQVGNKLFGAIEDSLNEYLIMDFDAEVGDTIYNLYSEGFLYDAKVHIKDSILVNNGVYHHYLVLEGFNITQNGDPVAQSWNGWYFTWNERALCSAYFVQEQFGSELGGVVYNIPPFYVISDPYAYPEFCTSDTIYTNPNSLLCANCEFQSASVTESKKIFFTISPNPVQNDLNITFDVSGNKEVHIYNSQGVSVFHKQTILNSELINIENLKDGLYIIQVQASGTVRRKRFIVK
tara:strand:- start:53 stop:997 length:945 start_codon:yes stop_codon:yes gene_type:complete